MRFVPGPARTYFTDLVYWDEGFTYKQFAFSSRAPTWRFSENLILIFILLVVL